MAVEMLADAFLNNKPQPERTLTEVLSIPPLDALRPPLSRSVRIP